MEHKRNTCNDTIEPTTSISRNSPIGDSSDSAPLSEIIKTFDEWGNRMSESGDTQKPVENTTLNDLLSCLLAHENKRDRTYALALLSNSNSANVIDDLVGELDERRSR